MTRLGEIFDRRVRDWASDIKNRSNDQVSLSYGSDLIGWPNNAIPPPHTIRTTCFLHAIINCMQLNNSNQRTWSDVIAVHVWLASGAIGDRILGQGKAVKRNVFQSSTCSVLLVETCHLRQFFFAIPTKSFSIFVFQSVFPSLFLDVPVSATDAKRSSSLPALRV